MNRKASSSYTRTRYYRTAGYRVRRNRRPGTGNLPSTFPILTRRSRIFFRTTFLTGIGPGS